MTVILETKLDILVEVIHVSMAWWIASTVFILSIVRYLEGLAPGTQRDRLAFWARAFFTTLALYGVAGCLYFVSLVSDVGGLMAQMGYPADTYRFTLAVFAAAMLNGLTTPIIALLLVTPRQRS